MTELKLLTNIATGQRTLRVIANSNTLAATSVPPATADPPKKRLVTCWLVDENSKLYCQWITEDKLK